MGVIIRKTQTGEVFDMISGFKLEINNTSPVFNDLGSKSVSTIVPQTPENVRLLGFSNRLDIRSGPNTRIPVIVSAGSYVRQGKLYTGSVSNRSKTFGITCAFNEGIMYEAMSDIKLTQLSNLPVIEKPVSMLIDDMSMLSSRENPEAHLSVFQINLKKQTYRDDLGTDQREKFFTEFLNKPANITLGNDRRLSERNTTHVLDDGRLLEIPVPWGYGITPFLRVWYLLELIFDHFGFRLKENPFKSDFQLKRLCLLNNTADAIVSGRLDYRQLLPDCSVFEFLHSLYCRFGLRVFFDGNTNEVNLKFLKDIFRTDAPKLIEAASFIDIEYATPKQVKLSVAKNLDMSATETETYEEFLSKYHHTIGSVKDSLQDVRAGGIYYDAATGLFAQIATGLQEKKIVSSVHFDWNKKDEGLETEEIAGTDEALTFYRRENDDYPVLYYAVDPRLMNSVLEVNGIVAKADSPSKLAFAYDMGEAYLENGGRQRNFLHFKYGSIFPFAFQSNDRLQEDRDGNRFRYSLTLIGKHGAFNNFFKEYDAFLRHSNHVVKFDIHCPTFELANIDFSKQRILDNQPVLLDKVDHLLDSRLSQTASVRARTVRLYEPFDLEKEQLLPVPLDIEYRWVMKSDRELTIKNKHDEIFDKVYKSSGTYSHISLSGGEVREDPNPPEATTFWFLPPTRKQYELQTRVGQRKHPCKVLYVHEYQTRGGGSMDGSWTTRSENLIVDLQYNSYFVPEPI